MAHTETDQIIDALVEKLKPSKKEKKAKKDLVIVINGQIANEFVSMKQAKKAAKRLSTTDAVVQVYSLKGTLTTNLDIEVK